MKKDSRIFRLASARHFRVSVLLAVLCMVLCNGVCIYIYHWTPFSLLVYAKDLSFKTPKSSSQDIQRGEKDLLRLAFTDPLIPGDMVYEPIGSIDEIYEANNELILPVNEFFTAYDHIEIVGTQPLALDLGATELLKVTYNLGGHQYHTYSYLRKNSKPVKAAALIIPSSRHNQSHRIYHNLHSGIMKNFEDSFDTYVFIKPNEDCLAFHNGTSKLNDKFLVNWLLNHGGSYSALYIANSIAITKYLKEKYDKVVLAGLSQGGWAAIFNSLQSQPTAAIIASGFSITVDKIRRGGHNQIIIPGIHQRLPSTVIIEKIRKSNTDFLLTYGQKEKGVYKIEAEQHLTCDYLACTQNVECGIHPGGHVYPFDCIREFLKKQHF